LPFGFMDDGMPVDEVLELPRGSNWMASAEDSF
jgi:hypothetical protein